MTGRLRPVPEPGHGRLLEIAQELERTGWAFEIVDASWRVVWFSEQLKLIVGEQDDAALGVGMHCLQTRDLEAWRGVITDDSEDGWSRIHMPFMLHADPSIASRLPAERVARIGEVSAAPAPSMWSYELRFEADPTQHNTRVSSVGIALREQGETIGFALIYGPATPASLLPMLLRGDEEQYGRMARLFQPGRTPAAILFADLEASTAISRRVPSRAFFSFVSAMATAMDTEVLSRSGIVGKHAGDGVTAFFTVDDLGSPAAAAAAAIEAARAMAGAVMTAARQVPAVERVLEERGCRLNAGLHWGPSLYMGQLVTGGRLEVTALGDEVNECARIEQAARGGALLAAKALMEQLGDEEARRLGVDPADVVYHAVEELPDVGDKALRDAGSIPVTDVALTPSDTRVSS